MNNKEFANALALATEKGKLGKSKTIAAFIKEHNGDSKGNVNLDGDVTPEIKTLASKLPKNLKINEPTIKEVLASVAESKPKTADKEPSTRTTRFKGSEW